MTCYRGEGRLTRIMLGCATFCAAFIAVKLLKLALKLALLSLVL